MKKLVIGICVLLSFVGCKIEPQKIAYGKDMCNFCKMTIVEEKHAAEIVTKKGRAYKYDAIECLINETNEQDKSKIALFLVTDYTQPRVLINASEAIFLVSKEIKSPMGAYLSAFSNKVDAEKYKGEIYNWKTIQQRFKD